MLGYLLTASSTKQPREEAAAWLNVGSGDSYRLRLGCRRWLGRGSWIGRSGGLGLG
jgi:hypothetical protein